MIRVVLPSHLRMHADIDGEVRLAVEGPVTQRSVMDALEARYPVLRGTIRDHGTQRRRPFLRFFACQRDISLEPPDNPLPEPVAIGAQPLAHADAFFGVDDFPGDFVGELLQGMRAADLKEPAAIIVPVDVNGSFGGQG